MDRAKEKASLLPDGLLSALRKRPSTPWLPAFDPLWLEMSPRLSAEPRAVGGGFSPVRRLQMAAAAGVLLAFALGAIFGTMVLRPSANGYSEVVRLRNGVRLRGKIVNLVGAQVVVETQDSVYVIDSEQVKSLNYGRKGRASKEYQRDFPDREMIEFSNGIVVRGRILNQVGNEFVVEADGESFTLSRSEVRKITYLAEAPQAQ